MILVFGAGQLGQELDALARQRCVELTLLRRDADIADEAAVSAAIERFQPDFVVNAAAYTAVDNAETEPGAAQLSNAIGPAVLADACAGAGVPMVHISTDYVFDGIKAGAYREDDPVNPLGVYGRSKLAGEVAVRERLREHLILRTSWVYGIYGRNFLKTIVTRAAEQPALRVVADQHGCPTSTRDLADAILRLRVPALAGTARWGTYHFAGNGETTWWGFAARIVAERNRLTGDTTVVEPIASAEYPTRARRPANSALDSGLFTRTFGIAARHWTEAADATVAALLEPAGAARRRQYHADPGAQRLE
jgi:dTDP-4-dehydrorhamnose reductase